MGTSKMTTTHINLFLCILFMALDFWQSSGVIASVLDNEVGGVNNSTVPCRIPDPLRSEIASYKPVVSKLVRFITSGKFKGKAWQTLSQFVDTFGARIAGSKNLENAIDFMLSELRDEGLENVHGEAAPVPHWVRGNESAELVAPRQQVLPILGLGGSVGTPKSGITAELLVVSSFDEFEVNKKLAKGRIVVFNENYTNYGDSVKYRDFAAAAAAKHGALATLVRSVTPFSISSPHTGWQDYDSNVTQIPTACITVEDAQMLHRMYQRGEHLVVHLYMEAYSLPVVKSRNTIAELRGRSLPEEIVVVSGHLDSWDVGQGAMDDGGGAFVSWVSLAAIKQLGLRPRRTMRAILWTGEEEGLCGAQEYVKVHASEQGKLDLAMESDEGTFTPQGLSFSGSTSAGCILQEILQLLQDINTTHYEIPQDGGPDIKLWTSQGVPGASLINSNERYFWFHHSNGDTMSVEDPKALDLCTALWAATSYVVADLSVTLPRT